MVRLAMVSRLAVGLTVLPVPCAESARSTGCWSAVRGSSPGLMWGWSVPAVLCPTWLAGR